MSGLNIIQGGGGVPSGTSFPASPAVGDVFFRTNLGWLCYYDGTRWLTAHEYVVHFPIQVTAVNSTVATIHVRTDYAIYVSRVACVTYVDAPNDGTKYWTMTVRGMSLDYASATTILTFNTSGDAQSTYISHDAAASTPNPANRTYVDITCAKTSTPGQLYIYPALYYRLIVT